MEAGVRPVSFFLNSKVQKSTNLLRWNKYVRPERESSPIGYKRFRLWGYGLCLQVLEGVFGLR